MKPLIVLLTVCVLGILALARPIPASAATQSTWMCKTWQNDPRPGWVTTHCTHYWHWANGVQVSDNLAWVPNVGKPATVPLTLKLTGRSYPDIGSPGSCAYFARLWQPYIYIPPTQAAKDFLAAAESVGDPTGTVPKVGAIVVFQPYVQGALNLGHVAVVTAIYAGGSFQIHEGSNWKTDYRTVHTGSGVGFIY